MACTLVARNTFWVAEIADEIAPRRPRFFSDSCVAELASSADDLPETEPTECNSERSLSFADTLSDLQAIEDLSEDLSEAFDTEVEDLTGTMDDSVGQASAVVQWLVLDPALRVQWVQPKVSGAPPCEETAPSQAEPSAKKKRRGIRGGQKLRRMLAIQRSARQRRGSSEVDHSDWSKGARMASSSSWSDALDA